MAGVAKQATILDVVPKWWSLDCTKCGRFVDVLAGRIYPGEAVISTLIDPRYVVCQDCLLAMADASARTQLEHRYSLLMKKRSVLGLLSRDLVADRHQQAATARENSTLFFTTIIDPEGWRLTVLSILSYGPMPGIEALLSRLTPWPAYWLLGPQGPAVGVAVHLGAIVGHIRVPIAQLHLNSRLDAADVPWTCTMLGWEVVTAAQRALLVEGLTLVEPQALESRGRPHGRDFGVEDFKKESEAWREQHGKLPNKDQLAELIGIHPQTILNTLRSENIQTFAAYQ
jgi:hypothetical protein